MNENIKEKIRISIVVTDMYNHDKAKIDFEYPAYPVGAYKEDIDIVMSRVVKIFGKDTVSIK